MNDIKFKKGDIVYLNSDLKLEFPLSVTYYDDYDFVHCVSINKEGNSSYHNQRFAGAF